jgi:hypothetical protein
MPYVQFILKAMMRLYFMFEAEGCSSNFNFYSKKAKHFENISNNRSRTIL